MFTDSLYEKSKSGERIRELFTLSIFTIAVAIISVIVMDILIFPIALFAINYKIAFNFIIRDISIFLLIFLFVFFILKKIYTLHKDGYNYREIIKFIIKKPFYYILIFFLFIISTSIIISILYILLNNNYYILYQFTNN